jgi:hypothetical protein
MAAQLHAGAGAARFRPATQLYLVRRKRGGVMAAAFRSFRAARRSRHPRVHFYGIFLARGDKMEL